jgi:uncharacterized protein (DUF4415 family)
MTNRAQNYFGSQGDATGEENLMRKLSVEQKRDIAAISAMRDEDIDLSEMPEVLDWSGAEMGKFYRPPKKSVTMRLDGAILEWLKGYGKGYQTRVNLLLRHAMASATAERAAPQRRQKSKRDRALQRYTATVTEVSVRVTGR